MRGGGGVGVPPYEFVDVVAYDEGIKLPGKLDERFADGKRHALAGGIAESGHAVYDVFIDLPAFGLRRRFGLVNLSFESNHWERERG
jgi:hypothetical protein